MFKVVSGYGNSFMKVSAAIVSISACAQAETVGVSSNADVGEKSSGCVATESELFEFFSKDGIMYANNAVIQISQDPNTQVISRDPFTYRIGNQQLCQDMGK